MVNRLTTTYGRFCHKSPTQYRKALPLYSLNQHLTGVILITLPTKQKTGMNPGLFRTGEYYRRLQLWYLEHLANTNQARIVANHFLIRFVNRHPFLTRL